MDDRIKIGCDCTDFGFINLAISRLSHKRLEKRPHFFVIPIE